MHFGKDLRWFSVVSLNLTTEQRVDLLSQKTNYSWFLRKLLFFLFFIYEKKSLLSLQHGENRESGGS